MYSLRFQSIDSEKDATSVPLSGESPVPHLTLSLSLFLSFSLSLSLSLPLSWPSFSSSYYTNTFSFKTNFKKRIRTYIGRHCSYTRFVVVNKDYLNTDAASVCDSLFVFVRFTQQKWESRRTRNWPRASTVRIARIVPVFETLKHMPCSREGRERVSSDRVS